MSTKEWNAYSEHKDVSSYEEKDRMYDAHPAVWLHATVNLSVSLLEIEISHSFEVYWVKDRYENRQ